MSVAQDVQVDDFARPRVPNPFIKIQETSHAKPIDTDYKIIALVKRDRSGKWRDYYRRWKRHHAEHCHGIQYITDRLSVWMQSRRGPGTSRLNINDQQPLDFLFRATRLDSQVNAEDRDLLVRIQIALESLRFGVGRPRLKSVRRGLAIR